MWILENTLIAAVFALVVALICRVPRVPPVLRHALWLVVLIRLIVPPVFSVPLLPADWREVVARQWGTGAIASETAAYDGASADQRDGAFVPGSTLSAVEHAGRPAVAGASDLPNPTPPALDTDDTSVA